jgi:hypothetical protein
MSRPLGLGYGSSMYGGGGLGGMMGGGLGSMMGGSMYGGGLMGGMGGMSGMGGVPGQPGDPNGFQQNYQGFFLGLQNLLQILYSGLGLFAFGKLFGSMVFNMVKTIAKKFFQGTKYILSLVFMNKVSIKIINGAISRAKTVSESSVGSIMAKALFTIGMACIGAVWFLMREDSLAEEEQRLRASALRRAREQDQIRRQMDALRTGLPMISETDSCSLTFEAGFGDAVRTEAATRSILIQELTRAKPEFDKAFDEAEVEVKEDQAKLNRNFEESDDHDSEDNKPKEEEVILEDKKEEIEGQPKIDDPTDEKEENEENNSETDGAKNITTPFTYNGPLPIKDDAKDSSFIFGEHKLEKKNSKCEDAEAEKKRYERQIKKNQEKKSEEFSSSQLMRSVSASENGATMRKLFLIGELIEKSEKDRYTDEEKDETRKKMEMMAAKIAQLSFTKSVPTKALNEKSFLAAPEELLQNNPEIPAQPIKKKKLWDK